MAVRKLLIRKGKTKKYSTGVMKETAIMIFASIVANYLRKDQLLSRTSLLLSLRRVSSTRTDSGALAGLLMRLPATSEWGDARMTDCMDSRRTACEQELGQLCGPQAMRETEGLESLIQLRCRRRRKIMVKVQR